MLCSSIWYSNIFEYYYINHFVDRCYINLPSSGDIVCNVRLRKVKEVVDSSTVSSVAFSGYVIHSPLPSSINVPFLHNSYLNPSGLTTYTNMARQKYTKNVKACRKKLEYVEIRLNQCINLIVYEACLITTIMHFFKYFTYFFLIKDCHFV